MVNNVDKLMKKFKEIYNEMDESIDDIMETLDLIDKVERSEESRTERNYCPFQFSGYHVRYCDLSDTYDVPCVHIGDKTVENDGVDYKECNYNSGSSQERYK